MSPFGITERHHGVTVFVGKLRVRTGSVLLRSKSRLGRAPAIGQTAAPRNEPQECRILLRKSKGS